MGIFPQKYLFHNSSCLTPFSYLRVFVPMDGCTRYSVVNVTTVKLQPVTAQARLAARDQFIRKGDAIMLGMNYKNDYPSILQETQSFGL